MKNLLLATMLAWSLSLFTRAPAFAQGGIYKWTDDQGRLYFSNVPTRNAEAVDDVLPPASAFSAQPEPATATTASTQPSEGTVPPSSTEAPVPSADSEPAVMEPAPEEQPRSALDAPPAASPDADTPELNEPAALSQEESAME